MLYLFVNNYYSLVKSLCKDQDKTLFISNALCESCEKHPRFILIAENTDTCTPKQRKIITASSHAVFILTDRFSSVICMSVLHINFAFYRHFTLGSVNVYNALRSIHNAQILIFFKAYCISKSIFDKSDIYLHSIIKKL